MSQTILVKVHRGNSLVVFGPDPVDGTQCVFGPLAAGQSVSVEKGRFIAADQLSVDVWDADDYAAAQAAEAAP